MNDALRSNTGKPQLGYLLTFPNAIRALARVMEYGREKYALYNYLRGAPTSQYVDCLLRHLTAWHEGEDLDAESGVHHIGHVVFNALMLLEVCVTMPERDRRPHVVLQELEKTEAATCGPLPEVRLSPAENGHTRVEFDVDEYKALREEMRARISFRNEMEKSHA